MVRDQNPTDELFWIKEISISYFLEQTNGTPPDELVTHCLDLESEDDHQEIQTKSELMVDLGSREPIAKNRNDSFTTSGIGQRPSEVREVPENPTLPETDDATCMEL
ncbi:hypothetical protein GOBAR_DD21132 [Gossypium barbadense]|nr:hypothetical protein GOBAR_DD21132 [Gossypium barbadense]